jgi:hypothetical protein
MAVRTSAGRDNAGAFPRRRALGMTCAARPSAAHRGARGLDFYIDEIPYPLITAFGLIAAAAGFWRGGRDGAVVALVVVGQLALSWASDEPIVGWLSVTTDIVTLAVCLALVLTGRSHWMIVATASPVLSIVTQALRYMGGITTWAYYSAQTAWFLVLLASLLIGSLLTPRRQAARPT